MRRKLLKVLASFGVVLCLTINVAFVHAASNYVTDCSDGTYIRFSPSNDEDLPVEIWPGIK